MAAHGAVRFYSSATLLDEEPAGDTAQSDRTRPTLVTFRQGDFVLVQWERAPGATAPPVTVCRIEAMFEVTGVITVDLLFTSSLAGHRWRVRCTRHSL